MNAKPNAAQSWKTTFTTFAEKEMAIAQEVVRRALARRVVSSATMSL
jgi:hypothetical protein